MARDNPPARAAGEPGPADNVPAVSVMHAERPLAPHPAAGVPGRRSLRRPAVALLLSLGLTVLFWPTLWAGGGLVGGDVYYYFLPQKAFFADRLKSGELPLWNPLVGNGYPQLAESQTGALYPLHWPLYRWLPLHVAFNASILGHYIWAFLGCYSLARRSQLSPPASLLSALVYTYSWFPPRVSLEWAIVGGSWLPWAVWCAENWLRTRRGHWPALLAAVLGLQMLAGHFLMAFLTQLTLAGYVLLRVLWSATGPIRTGEPGIARPRVRLVTGVMLAGVTAFLLASVQLIPTWELKTNSQRAAVTDEHNPDYGHIPARYYAQIVAPWKWYSSEAELKQVVDPSRARTNWVEAHLYFGLLPLLLAGIGCAVGSGRGPGLPHHTMPGGLRCLWGIAVLLALVYTTGWLVPLTNHLPGFSFFEGPGRYGVICTLGMALLAGAGFSAIDERLWGLGRLVFCSVAFGLTGIDLWLVSRAVGHAVPVAVAPVSQRESSPIWQMLRNAGPTRMLNEGKSLPSLVGAGTYPVYLGLGPAAYFDPEIACPQPLPFREVAPTSGQLDWLANNGVTHVLSLTPLELSNWPARQLWSGPDPCLNLPLGRPVNSRFYLYELSRTRGRVAWLEGPATGTLSLRVYQPELVEVETVSTAGGTVVLTDLHYPGWQLTLDGQPATSLVVEQHLRGAVVPPGKHVVRWTYRPASLYWGLAVSVLGLVVTGALWWLVGEPAGPVTGAAPPAAGAARAIDPPVPFAGDPLKNDGTG